MGVFLLHTIICRCLNLKVSLHIKIHILLKSFQDLGISLNIAHALPMQGIRQPFPIQEKVIPAVLKGKDIMAIAPTGSGKTASFILPILEKRQHKNYTPSRDIPVLILVPTRELALQIEQFANSVSHTLKREIRTMAVYGGTSINPQMKYMNGVEILIATPGRLIDLLERKTLFLNQVKTLVIDEADKIFQLGFEEELHKILKKIPDFSQRIFLSATLNDKVEAIQATIPTLPFTVTIEKEKTDVTKITQLAYGVSTERKGPFLRYLLKNEIKDRVLIFVSATRTADNLIIKLKKNGLNAVALHSKKSQAARNIALEDFKAGKIQVLIATDVLARGVHIDGLPYVVNYELPRSPLDYIHRIGRTGRAGEFGTAISLISEEEMHHFEVIQKKAKIKIDLQDTTDTNLHGY